jgi:hypothetical protein
MPESSHRQRVGRYNQIAMKLTGTVWLGWALTAQIVFQPTLSAPPVLGGRLAGAVLLGEAPLTSHDIPSDAQASYKARLEMYVERGQAFKTRQGIVAGSFDTWKRRERLEQEIASTIDRPDIGPLAHAIAWSQGPYGVTRDALEEATWAEGLLRDPANQAATPYLYAFLASRYRLQFEGATEDRPLLERLAKKYKTMLDRVRNAGDPLFVLLADDLDARAGLSPGATRHPRQYLPET